MRNCIEARTQGYSADETILLIGVGKTRCGDIKDGVWLNLGRGDFVIPWEDFHAAYQANAEWRERLRKEAESKGGNDRE